MNQRDQLEELLVDWGMERERGNELTAEEICKDHPELAFELSTLIRNIKTTDWLEDDDASDDKFLQLRDFSTASGHRDPTRLPESRRSLDQFCEGLIESGLMDEEVVDELRTRNSTGTTQSLAEELVADKKLTPFQATVLLEGRDVPLVLDRYILLGEVGKGGMGAVYKALHLQMDRVVALKILPKEAVDSDDKVKRFRREVKAAARLEHPNIVTAFDAHEDKGYHFLVMSLVNGGDLAELIRKEGPFPAPKAVDCITQAARGLEHAHSMGIVHRDIKPGNLLLDDQGQVKLLDMGLARLDSSDAIHEQTLSTELTQAGMVMGTIAYLAPEQALDTRHADARSDIYSLGCTLFSLLTARPIYVEDTVLKTIMAHREAEIPSLCDERVGIPEELDAVFQKMVAKNPEDRFQSMSQVISALEQLDLKADETGPSDIAASQAMHDTATLLDTNRVAVATAASRSKSHSDVRHPIRRWGYVAVGLLGLASLLAGLVIALQLQAGAVVLKINQPELVGAVVTLDGVTRTTIRTGKGNEIIPFTPDAELHTLEVTRPGFKTFTEEFTFDTGNRKTIRVHLEQVNAAAGEDPPPRFPPYSRDREAAEWVLSLGGKVDVKQAGLPPKAFIAEAKDLPEGTFILTHVHLPGTEPIEPQEFEVLEHLPGLFVLNLQMRPLTQDIFPHLKRLTHLQYVNFNETGLTSSDFAAQGWTFPYVHFDINADQIDDDGEFLKHFPLLNTLAVGRVFDESLNMLCEIRDFSGVPTIIINDGGNIRQETFERFRSAHPEIRVLSHNNLEFLPGKLMPAVAKLVESGCTVEGTTFDGSRWRASNEQNASGTLRRIETLVLPKGERVGPEISTLMQGVTLHWNHIDATEIVGADDFVRDIAHRFTLSTFDLSGSDLSDSGLGQLSKAPHWHLLNLEGTQVSLAGIQQFKLRHPDCEILSDFGSFEFDRGRILDADVPSSTEGSQD